MIPPKYYFTKSTRNKWTCISETPLNNLITHDFRPVYLVLQKPMLINSADMLHLPPISHWSIFIIYVKMEFRKFFQLEDILLWEDLKFI